MRINLKEMDHRKRQVFRTPVLGPGDPGGVARRYWNDTLNDIWIERVGWDKDRLRVTCELAVKAD